MSNRERLNRSYFGIHPYGDRDPVLVAPLAVTPTHFSYRRYKSPPREPSGLYQGEGGSYKGGYLGAFGAGLLAVTGVKLPPLEALSISPPIVAEVPVGALSTKEVEEIITEARQVCALSRERWGGAIEIGGVWRGDRWSDGEGLTLLTKKTLAGLQEEGIPVEVVKGFETATLKPGKTVGDAVMENGCTMNFLARLNRVSEARLRKMLLEGCEVIVPKSEAKVEVVLGGRGEGAGIEAVKIQREIRELLRRSDLDRGGVRAEWVNVVTGAGEEEVLWDVTTVTIGEELKTSGGRIIKRKGRKAYVGVTGSEGRLTQVEVSEIEKLSIWGGKTSLSVPLAVIRNEDDKVARMVNVLTGEVYKGEELKAIIEEEEKRAPTPNPSLAEELPREQVFAGKVVLEGIPVDTQDTLVSCEASAAGMAAIGVTANRLPDGYASWEKYFMDVIPSNPNPHEGFRGNVETGGGQSMESAYGVYVEPVAEAFRKAGIPCRILGGGEDYKRVEEYIRKGYPVMVWVSGNMKAPVEIWMDPETGQKVKLISGEHAWLVTGVSADGSRFLVHEPYPGMGERFWVTIGEGRRNFPNWSRAFDGMALVVGVE